MESGTDHNGMTVTMDSPFSEMASSASTDPYNSNTLQAPSHLNTPLGQALFNNPRPGIKVPLTNLFDHQLVSLGGKQRPCVVCKQFRRRTKCGDPIRSYYKCDKCEVVLCRGTRFCFEEFHRRMYQSDTCINQIQITDLGWFKIGRVTEESWTLWTVIWYIFEC